MNDAYRTEIQEHNGRTYRIEWEHDSHMGAPWKEHDGHGIVSDWTTRDKKPGEWVLHNDGHMKRYYDAQATIEIAKRDGWNTKPYNWTTKGEQAAQAVLADFKHLQDWCNDQWHWCCIAATLLDDDGNETEHTAAIGGVEDGTDSADDHHQELIADLIGQIEHELERETYPVTHMGV
jgi:hypothetical protein